MAQSNPTRCAICSRGVSAAAAGGVIGGVIGAAADDEAEDEPPSLVGSGSDMTGSPAAVGVVTRVVDAMRLSPVNLVHRPCGGAVLSDIWTGAAVRAGDLVQSLDGCGSMDRA